MLSTEGLSIGELLFGTSGDVMPFFAGGMDSGCVLVSGPGVGSSWEIVVVVALVESLEGVVEEETGVVVFSGPGSAEFDALSLSTSSTCFFGADSSCVLAFF